MNLAIPPRVELAHSAVFGAVATTIVILAALLVGSVPLGVAIGSVFLFAGPHNYLELRYFLGRMPARWGTLRNYFSCGLGGIFLLGVSWIILAYLSRARLLPGSAVMLMDSFWLSLFTLWIGVLVTLRGHEPRQPDRELALPVAFFVVALIWLYPLAAMITMVYAHPLVALFFLERELANRRPEWRRVYHRVLLLIPVVLIALYWRFADTPAFAETDLITQRLVRNVGSGLFTDISPRFLLAAHTFLELLHYGVWIVALPLLTFGNRLADLRTLPVARRGPIWVAPVLGLAAAAGLLAVVGLWGGFATDYSLTRDIYFTVAVFHVLAEVPYLIRSL